MKKTHLTFLLSAVFMVMAANAAARAIFEPVAIGEIAGTGYSAFGKLFDGQPVISDLPETGFNTVSGNELGTSIGSYNNRIAVGYVDFGSDYANVQITELWTAYRSYTTEDGQTPFVDLWWADSLTLTTEESGGVTSVTKDPLHTVDITDPNFNFGTQAITNTNEVTWSRDAEFLTAVVPEHRYLLIATSMASNTNSQFSTSNRATEIAIVTIPEPSTLVIGLMAIGYLLRLKYRK